MQEVTFIKPLCVYLLQVRTQHASYQLFILLGGWKDVCVCVSGLIVLQTTDCLSVWYRLAAAYLLCQHRHMVSELRT